MNQHFQNIVLDATSAKTITGSETIQSLWSGYGEIVRLTLQDADIESAILKYIVLPDNADHPRGWNTELSHARKIRSYDVEMHWYRDWSQRCDDTCRVAKSYTAFELEHERVIVLEDLDKAGYPVRKSGLTKGEAKPCLHWLANFHATFMGESPTGLWPTGTYWHLATRPDELAAMKDNTLQQAADKIDRLLNNCRYQTLVHGDAKVANFCFSVDKQVVAAVDFQYVGGGCGMKDVAYFLGSCLSEDECERHEAELLDYYFDSLKAALATRDNKLDWATLESEWRTMFPIAWTDFYRFLLGWMPNHWKINDYSHRLAKRAIAKID